MVPCVCRGRAGAAELLPDDQSNDASTRPRRWLTHEDSAPEHPHPPLTPQAETGAESFGAPATHRPGRGRPAGAGRVSRIRRVPRLGRGRGGREDRHRPAPRDRPGRSGGPAAARRGRCRHLPAQPAHAPAPAADRGDGVPGDARARALDHRHGHRRAARRPGGGVRPDWPERPGRADRRLDPGRARDARRRRARDRRLAGRRDAGVGQAHGPRGRSRGAPLRGGRPPVSRAARRTAGAARGAEPRAVAPARRRLPCLRRPVRRGARSGRGARAAGGRRRRARARGVGLRRGRRPARRAHPGAAAVHARAQPNALPAAEGVDPQAQRGQPRRRPGSREDRPASSSRRWRTSASRREWWGW